MDSAEFIKRFEALTPDNRAAIEKIVLSLSPDKKDGEWITVADAAGILGVSGQTIRRNIRIGIIPFRNNSQRKTVVDRATVERLAQMQ